jgi:hypothetical protein
MAMVNSGRDIITMIAFLIVLLFNWLTLKQLEGFMITTNKNQTVLRILALVVAFIFLLNSVLSLWASYSGKFDVLAFLILLKIIFVTTITLHAVKSHKIRLAE